MKNPGNMCTETGEHNVLHRARVLIGFTRTREGEITVPPYTRVEVLQTMGWWSLVAFNGKAGVMPSRCIERVEERRSPGLRRGPLPREALAIERFDKAAEYGCSSLSDGCVTKMMSVTTLAREMRSERDNRGMQPLVKS